MVKWVILIADMENADEASPPPPLVSFKVALAFIAAPPFERQARWPSWRSRGKIDAAVLADASEYFQVGRWIAVAPPPCRR